MAADPMSTLAMVGIIVMIFVIEGGLLYWLTRDFVRKDGNDEH